MTSITQDCFGTVKDPITKDEESIIRYTLSRISGDDKIVLQVMTLGATITSLKVPDFEGYLEDVVLGFDTPEAYISQKYNPYFGATIGRVANRIAHGYFTVKGVKIRVSQNLNYEHTLHGGFISFSHVIWSVLEVDEDACRVTFKHVSAPNQEGFPGKVVATVSYQLSTDNILHVKMTAQTDMATPINMTNHSYFNLMGHHGSRGDLYNHLIYINADSILETDHESIPTGKFLKVKDTPFDFRMLKPLGLQMQKVGSEGFDDNFCITVKKRKIPIPLIKDDKTCAGSKKKKIPTVAKAIFPPSGRVLELCSDQPGLQFYTANYLPSVGAMERPLVGKNGIEYVRQCAFCFEPQGYPDAVNHPNFPSIILEPNEKYEHNIVYKFSTLKGDLFEKIKFDPRTGIPAACKSPYTGEVDLPPAAIQPTPAIEQHGTMEGAVGLFGLAEVEFEEAMGGLEEAQGGLDDFDGIEVGDFDVGGMDMGTFGIM